MARGFGSGVGVGSTDKVVSASTSHATTRSYFAHSNRNGAGGGNFGRIMDHGPNLVSIFENVTADSTYVFNRAFSTATGQWKWSAPTDNAWHTIGVTYNDSSNSNDPTVFMDGTKLTVGSGLTESVTPTGTATSPSGSAVHFGNRSDDLRNWNGRLAECAIWDVILTDGEFAALARGVCPLMIRPASLVEYIPMRRDNVSRKLAAPTITGTTVLPHPAVIYPGGRYSPLKTVAPVGGFQVAWARNVNSVLGTGIR